MKIGPDGKPEIQEFGNIKKGLKGAPQIKDEREPLVDIVETNGEVHAGQKKANEAALKIR